MLLPKLDSAWQLQPSVVYEYRCKVTRKLNLATCNGEGDGTPLQYSCLESPMDRGAWWAAVHGVAKHLTRLSEFTFTFHFHSLEKEMATHSSVLAWRIPGMGEPGGLPSLRSHRVGHDWSDLAAGELWIEKTQFLKEGAMFLSLSKNSAYSPSLPSHCPSPILS